MKNNNDHIVDINQADIKRKNSSPNILIGTARRVNIFIIYIYSFLNNARIK
jgi:hypothetical protein